MAQTPPVIAILVVPEATASVVYGLYDLFHSAGRDWGTVTTGAPGEALLAPLLVARERGPLEVCNGVWLSPQATLADCPPSAIVCVPDINIAPGEPFDGRFDPELAFLRRRAAEGALLAAACSGALLFAEAGLLDGHEATTHWAYCDVLRTRFPGVTVREQRALVVSGDQGRLVMAGGGTSWLDLALYLIARSAGVDAAMQVARINLIDWHRVGQQPYARLARTRQVEDALVARCQAWIAEHYQEPKPVAGMVRLSGLAERTFNRRFQQATGMSPLDYVHALRLEEAKQMLEATALSVEQVAAEVGYEDAGFFGRLFRRKVQLTPAQYRRRFGELRQRLQGGGHSAVAMPE